jgi:hypothetical protein
VVKSRKLLDDTVIQVDIRPFDWDDSRAWYKAVLAAYPYGLDRPDVAKMITLAGDELPFVRADWFVAVASQDPLFSRLLHPKLQAAGNVPEPVKSITEIRTMYERDLSLLKATLELGLADPNELLQKMKEKSLRDVLDKRHLQSLQYEKTVSRKRWTAPGIFGTNFQVVAGTFGWTPYEVGK